MWAIETLDSERMFHEMRWNRVPLHLKQTKARPASYAFFKQISVQQDATRDKPGKEIGML